MRTLSSPETLPSFGLLFILCLLLCLMCKKLGSRSIESSQVGEL